MNKLTKIALAASLLVGGIASTQACSLGAWDLNGLSTSVAGGPAEAGALNFARYQGLCSMQTAGLTPQVLNNGQDVAVSGPNGEGNMIARFYFLPGGVTGPIFTAYSDNLATVPVYTVSYDGTNVSITDGVTTQGFAVSTTINWHSVEIKWATGDGIAAAGSIEMWVDSDALTAASSDVTFATPVAATSVQAVNLGGTSGMIFDAYESRRTTSIGRLLKGDGNGNGSYSVADAVVILNEALSPTTNTATGTPDTNEDGNVTVGDAILTLNLALGA